MFQQRRASTIFDSHYYAWADRLAPGLRGTNACRWYKRKPMDSAIFNEGNTASTYNEQRLFLQSGSNRSTRLLGGSMYGGDNQIWAHKRGNHQAEMKN